MKLIGGYQTMVYFFYTITPFPKMYPQKIIKICENLAKRIFTIVLWIKFLIKGDSQINNDKLYIQVNYRHQKSHKKKVQKDFVNLRHNKNTIRKYWLIDYLKM